MIVPAGTYDDTFALRSAELWEQRPPQPLWLGEASVPRRAIILSNDKFNDWVAKAAYDDATAAGAVWKIATALQHPSVYAHKTPTRAYFSNSSYCVQDTPHNRAGWLVSEKPETILLLQPGTRAPLVSAPNRTAAPLLPHADAALCQAGL